MKTLEQENLTLLQKLGRYYKMSIDWVSLISHVSVWFNKEKREKPTSFIAYIHNKRINHPGKTYTVSYFVIENIGKNSAMILDCQIDGVPITEYLEILEAKRIIGIVLKPTQRIEFERLPGIQKNNQINIGGYVIITYKSDSGKTLRDDCSISRGDPL